MLHDGWLGCQDRVHCNILHEGCGVKSNTSRRLSCKPEIFVNIGTISTILANLAQLIGILGIFDIANFALGTKNSYKIDLIRTKLFSHK